MAAYEHLLKSYNVSDQLDDIASADPPAYLHRCFAEGYSAALLSLSRVRQLAVCAMVVDSVANGRDYEFFEHELIADRRIHYAGACSTLKEAAAQALRRVLERERPQDPEAAAGRPSAAGAGCRKAFLAAMAAVLLGCQSAPPRSTRPPGAAVPQPNPGETARAAQQSDGSYDWHRLLIAPFGAVLKAVPLTLHEVLLFRDQSPDSGSDDSAGGASDCYAADTPAPPFAGRTPDEYVLCFTRDRLARIQVSLRMAATEAPGVFAAGCAAWLKNAPPAAETPAAETGTAEAGAAGCEGRDGAVRFSGRLGEAADRSGMPPAESTLFITLESVSAP